LPADSRCRTSQCSTCSDKQEQNESLQEDAQVGGMHAYARVCQAWHAEVAQSITLMLGAVPAAHLQSTS
jgi:hypothetical protein